MTSLPISQDLTTQFVEWQPGQPNPFVVVDGRLELPVAEEERIQAERRAFQLPQIETEEERTHAQ